MTHDVFAPTNHHCQNLLKEGVLYMRILVLGGAGYIGSHAVHQLIDDKKEVIVIDNLQTGHEEAIHPEATFYNGDIRDKSFLRDVFTHEAIDAVVHFAANSRSEEHTSELQSRFDLVCRLLLEKKKE